MKILVLNAGSSSQKTSLYDLSSPLPENPPSAIWEGKLDWRDGRATLDVRTSAAGSHKEEMAAAAPSDATARLIELLMSGETQVISSKSEIAAIGHRIVNGGAEYTQPTLVNGAVKSAIKRMLVFAPLHNKAGLDGIDLVEKLFGADVPQIAVFDTGFHSNLPQVAAIYPGPYEWAQQGIRRYGFHGINHKYAAERAAHLLGSNLTALKLVSCHLGNGCSLAAIRDGHSVDTTMGFTPLEGLMMGTRSGSIDPAIVTYLMREQHLDASEIDDLLNKKSGLLGISGISADMRHILSAMKEGHARAKLAFDIFVHRLQTGIGAMIAALGGFDALIFTAGIGENSPDVRTAACSNLAFAGIALDESKNAAPQTDSDVSASGSRARIFVIRAQEDWSVAKDCWGLLHSSREHDGGPG
jgi:acetate kinase